MWPCYAQINENQLQAIVEDRVKTKKKDKKGMMKEDPSNVKLTCRSCSVAVCSGEDIEIIERMHHVNVTEAFRYNLYLGEILVIFYHEGAFSMHNTHIVTMFWLS